MGSRPAEHLATSAGLASWSSATAWLKDGGNHPSSPLWGLDPLRLTDHPGHSRPQYLPGWSRAGP